MAHVVIVSAVQETKPGQRVRKGRPNPGRCGLVAVAAAPFQSREIQHKGGSFLQIRQKTLRRIDAGEITYKDISVHFSKLALFGELGKRKPSGMQKQYLLLIINAENFFVIYNNIFVNIENQ
jgi:hypothetical protein